MEWPFLCPSFISPSPSKQLVCHCSFQFSSIPSFDWLLSLAWPSHSLVGHCSVHLFHPQLTMFSASQQLPLSPSTMSHKDNKSKVFWSPCFPHLLYVPSLHLSVDILASSPVPCLGSLDTEPKKIIECYTFAFRNLNNPFLIARTVLRWNEGIATGLDSSSIRATMIYSWEGERKMKDLY